MKNILVVEDDVLMNELLEKFLSQNGYNVISGTDGSEGVKEIAKSKIDLIISDIQMKPMDGVTFLESLRARGDMTPFILITGQPDIETYIHSVHQLGALEYIEKPFDLDILMEMVNRLLLSEGEMSTG